LSLTEVKNHDIITTYNVPILIGISGVCYVWQVEMSVEIGWLAQDVERKIVARSKSLWLMTLNRASVKQACGFMN
jgi:hypothetical protein